MNTDRAFSGYNKNLMWAAMFSDDRSQVWRNSQIVDGCMKRALEGTWKWAKEKRVSYHLTGIKEPIVLIFRNKQVLVGKKRGKDKGTAEWVPVDKSLSALMSVS